MRLLRGDLTLRLRLALLSTALLGAALLLFSVLVYFTLARALYEEVDRALVDRARVVIGSITVEQSPRGGAVFGLPDVDAIAAAGAVVQIVELNGNVAARSEALRGMTLPISSQALQAVGQGQDRFDTVSLAGVELRIYSRPLAWRGSMIGVLQVARPIGPTAAALAPLRLTLAAGTLVSVAVCALLGLFLSRAALRPVDRLTREAERIGRSQDFGQRLVGAHASGTDEVSRLTATFNNMLDRLQGAFAALQSANRRLEAALESQRRFVADASHELRTPLTTVRGNASLLRRFGDLTPEDRAGAVEQIAAESERMSRLVGQLLTLARADAGQRLERQAVALGPLIDAVALQGRILADGKLSLSLLRLADAEVIGDADALRQLLLILVDNAIKYTPPNGSVTISLSVESVGAARFTDQKVARISVVDTGIGIAPDDLSHIFERFYRADRARGTGGTGLGLSIGKWIAEAHGGTITVESSPGSGSIFTVVLPVGVAAGDDAPPDPLSLPLPEPTRYSRHDRAGQLVG